MSRRRPKWFLPVLLLSFLITAMIVGISVFPSGENTKKQPLPIILNLV